jgi:hypothetical protein
MGPILPSLARFLSVKRALPTIGITLGTIKNKNIPATQVRAKDRRDRVFSSRSTVDYRLFDCFSTSVLFDFCPDELFVSTRFLDKRSQHRDIIR